jgi:eukaryotic-like serine/threonine-protein kinase
MSTDAFSQAGPYPVPGEVLDGKYRIEKLLGEGGMGAVAKATHVLRRAPVALKFMSPAVLSMAGAVERFINEGVAASQIDSDHVVKVFDVGRMPSGAPYLVMEFLEGCDLSQLLEREGGRLPMVRAVNFTLQILRALQSAHAAGIVHRDMKPSNVFVVTKDGDSDFVKLVDFGISKVRTGDDAPSGNLTRTNSALGTPLYMSPEQARSPKDVDARTDLYSTGAILYEMLAARTPYTSETGEFTEILYKIFTTDPDPIRSYRPDLPDGFAAAVHRALVRDLGQRFASALEMAEAIAMYGDDKSQLTLARMRGGRIGMSSVAPGTAPLGGDGGGSYAVMPSQVNARATGVEDATAKTFIAESIAPPQVQTDMGAAKEAPSTQLSAQDAKRGRTGLALVAAASAALFAGGAFAIARLHPAAEPRREAPAVAVPAPVQPLPTATLAPMPAPPTTPPAAPSASASASASAQAPERPKPATPARAPAQPPKGLPKQLGDVTFH